jgi:hypothetical protein
LFFFIWFSTLGIFMKTESPNFVPGLAKRQIPSRGTSPSISVESIGESLGLSN